MKKYYNKNTDKTYYVGGAREVYALYRCINKAHRKNNTRLHVFDNDYKLVLNRPYAIEITNEIFILCDVCEKKSDDVNKVCYIVDANVVLNLIINDEVVML